MPHSGGIRRPFVPPVPRSIYRQTYSPIYTSPPPIRPWTASPAALSGRAGDADNPGGISPLAVILAMIGGFTLLEALGVTNFLGLKPKAPSAPTSTPTSTEE
jgi:hypothetical protein